MMKENTELDELQRRLHDAHASADMLRQRIVAIEAELKAYRHGGITEEILRRNDGYIKVGQGCVIVRESDWQNDGGVAVANPSARPTRQMN